MKKILIFAAAVSGALALTACGSKTEEAPMEPAETEMMAPAEEPTAESTDEAAAAEGLDPTGNPIRPAAGDTAPAEADAVAE